MISAVQFRDNAIGKALDIDGVAGAQCVDLFKQVCYLAGMKPFSLGGSGYAHEISKRFDALGLGVIFAKVSIQGMKYGDWIIWDYGSVEAPYSHVAMFLRYDGSGRAVVLGQNQNGIIAANEASISLSGVIAVLRLKLWNDTAPSTPTPSQPGKLVGSAIKYWTVDPGDTLSAIALEMRQSVAAVASYNNIANPNLIYVGQVINNPGYKK